MVVFLKRRANDLHMAQLMPLPPHYLFFLVKIHNSFTFLVLAYPGYAGKEAVKCRSDFLSIPRPYFLSNFVMMCSGDTDGRWYRV